jgi:hypothetical protein
LSGARGVEVRTKQASCADQAAIEAKSGFHPSMQAIRLSLEKTYVSSQAPAVSDRIEIIRRTGQSLRHSLKTIAFPPFRAIQADVLKRDDLQSFASFRSARTNGPAFASTSGSGCLAGLTGLAKGKIHTSFRRPNSA